MLSQFFRKQANTKRAILSFVTLVAARRCLTNSPSLLSIDFDSAVKNTKSQN